MSSSCSFQNLGKSTVNDTSRFGSIAQGLEHWSCKPGVVSSILAGASHLLLCLAFPGGLDGKASTYNAGDRV